MTTPCISDPSISEPCIRTLADCTPAHPTVPGGPGLAPWQVALDRHRAEFAAVPKEQLIEITIDIPDAMILIASAVAKWEPYWHRLQALPEVDHGQLRAIESLGLATWGAHTSYIVSTPPVSDLYQTLTCAIGIRDSLLFDARVMVRRGLLSADALDGIVRQQGYEQVATELGRLVSLLQNHWQNVEGKVSTTPEELQHALSLVRALTDENAVRPTRTQGQAEAALLRQQAFTVLSRAYNEMRRCLRFLARRDVEQLAPSLYKGRGGRKRKPRQLPALTSAC